jgi:hypothetical protein
LLYWYKSACFTAAKSTREQARAEEWLAAVLNLLSVLVLYWYKSTNTDAKGASRPRKRWAGTMLPARTLQALVC